MSLRIEGGIFNRELLIAKSRAICLGQPMCHFGSSDASMFAGRKIGVRGL